MEKTELNSHMGFKSVSNIGLEKKKTLDLELVLWVSSSQILLACVHFLLLLFNDFFRGWLAQTIAHWASRLKSYLLSKKIYLSHTT